MIIILLILILANLSIMAICGICLLNIYSPTFNLECNHKFHIKCLNEWRKAACIHNPYYQQFSCPYCRERIAWVRTRRSSCIIKIKDFFEVLSNKLSKNNKLVCMTILFQILLDSYPIFHGNPKFLNSLKERIPTLKEEVIINNGNIKPEIKDNFLEMLELCYSKYLLET